MKKILIWLLTSVLVLSLMFVGISCKPEVEEIADKIADELIEESKEEAPDEEEMVEEEAVEEEGPIYGGVVRIGLPGEAQHMDYSMDNLLMSWVTGRPMNDFLVKIDRQNNVTPRLATEWEFTDGKTLKMVLRQGVKFHNGREVVAEDVKNSIDRIQGDVLAGSFSVNIVSIESVEVIDDYNFIVHLGAPDATILAGLELIPIIPIEALDEEGYMRENPVGCGPYKFVSWEKGVKTTMERFDDFWESDENGNQLPYLDGIEIIPIPTYAPLLSALMSGDIDYVTQVYHADIAQWKENPVEGIQFDDGGYAPYTGYFIAFNTVDGPFKDNENLRLAIKYAIDSAEINEIVFKGLVEGWQITHIAKDSPYYNPEWEYEPDLELAKEYLVKAGYPDGVKVNLETGKMVPLESLTLLIKDQLARIGIELDANVREVPQYVETVVSFNFESFLTGAPTIADPGPFFENMMKTDGSWNLARYSVPETDEMLAEARAETDFDKRYALYDQIESSRIDHAWPYLVFTSGSARFSAASTRVQNYESQVNGVFDWSRLWLSE